MTRVLLVRLSAMGDVVQSLGAIQALAQARPQLELHVLTQREHAPLLQGCTGIAGVIAHDRRGGLGAVLRTVRAIRALGCEIALDLQGNWKSAVFARLSGAPRRVGAGAAWRQEPASRILLSKTVTVAGGRHPARVAAAVVDALVPGIVVKPPRLAATAAEVAAVAARIEALGVDPQRPFRVVSVGRFEDPRSQRREELAKELRDEAMPTIALLGPAEVGMELPVPVPALAQTRGQLRELVALGALLTQAGGSAVGIDHGPTHVLAGAGASTTVLFGPQDPRLTAPPAARVLVHPSPPACMPCRRRRCTHADGPVCMAFGSRDGRTPA